MYIMKELSARINLVGILDREKLDGVGKESPLSTDEQFIGRTRNRVDYLHPQALQYTRIYQEIWFPS